MLARVSMCMYLSVFDGPWGLSPLWFSLHFNYLNKERIFKKVLRHLNFLFLFPWRPAYVSWFNITWSQEHVWRTSGISSLKHLFDGILCDHQSNLEFVSCPTRFPSSGTDGQTVRSGGSLEDPTSLDKLVNSFILQICKMLMKSGIITTKTKQQLIIFHTSD